MAEENVLLQNVVLSHRPCPDCVEADGQIMTYAEWAASKFGLPGSSGRVCEDDCHCVLVPVDQMADFPGIADRVKLRGDEGSDIRKIIDIGPAELTIKEWMQEWYKLGNRILPREIYDMDFDDVLPYLKKKVLAARAAVGDAQV